MNCRPKKVAPVEISTNPMVRLLFRDQVDNPLGSHVMTVPEEVIEIEEWKGEHDLECFYKRDAALNMALALILFLQIPAGVLSFAVSPTVEWEIIGGCFSALLVLKIVIARTAAVWAVTLGAVLANVLMGALVGELIHFGFECSLAVVDLSAVGAAVIGLLLAAAFYLCLLGDGWYVLRTQRLRIEVMQKGEKIFIRESPARLSARERWWLTWGLSTAPLWSPFHILYMLCRFVDWLTAGLLVEAACALVFVNTLRQRR